ncbi:hypothetical protein [Tautonia marina]|uniref:hypothetical protein n=1 Tax=Tautonia marina TaxID=2653855 RepID=UPI001260CF1A|nr:hypothetical protein [Tautonia marina]
MSITAVFAYLMGDRRAILAIASDRKALVVGALLVLSAALARNYDRVWLIHEPWRLLGPFVASLAISVPLFLTIYGFARLKGMKPVGMARAYGSFLALYWMTAPLAWLYGIPYERFLRPLDAVSANLWTLALVSVWRVALMVEVVSVIFGMKVRVAIPLVMLVADAAALTALWFIPLPVVGMMGGVSPEQSAVAMTALLVRAWGILSLPVWIILVIWFASNSEDIPKWQVPAEPEPRSAGRGAIVFTGLALLAWAALLPITQPEQLRAHRVDRAYDEGGPTAALALMSDHDRGDFPPAWTAPPHRFPGEPTTDEVLDMLEALAEQPHADWVEDVYADRFMDRVRYDWFEWPPELLDQHAERLAAILPRLRRGPEMIRELDRVAREWGNQSIERRLEDETLSESKQEALQTLHRLSRSEDESNP